MGRRRRGRRTLGPPVGTPVGVGVGANVFVGAGEGTDDGGLVGTPVGTFVGAPRGLRRGRAGRRARRRRRRARRHGRRHARRVGRGHAGRRLRRGHGRRRRRRVRHDDVQPARRLLGLGHELPLHALGRLARRALRGAGAARQATATSAAAQRPARRGLRAMSLLSTRIFGGFAVSGLALDPRGVRRGLPGGGVGAKIASPLDTANGTIFGWLATFILPCRLR